MKKFLILFLLLILALSFLIFNDKGNEYLKPYVTSYVKKYLQDDMSLEIQHLKIDMDYVEFTATLNELTTLEAKGDISFLSQNFDLDYNLSSDGFKNEQISFENNVAIQGTAKGTAKNMHIEGAGETLKSHIDYALNIKDELISNIKVKINKADIASLLQLTSQPIYANGKVDVDIDIPTFENENTKGTAKIIVYKTTLDEKVLKEQLKVNLPAQTTLTANLNTKVKGEIFELQGSIKSDLAWLKLSKTLYNTSNKKLSSNYKLIIPELSKLASLTKQELRGQLQVDGTTSFHNKKLFINGKTKDLDGETNFDYNGTQFNVTMNQISIAKLLYLLKQKPYATGTLVAHANIEDLKKLRGSYEIKTKNAQALNATLQNEFNLNLQQNTPFSLESTGELASGLANIQSKLSSDIFHYRSSDMVYDLNTKKLNSTYLLNIADLSKLSTLAGKPLKGEVNVKGRLNFEKTLTITGSTKNLGGNIGFNLLDKILSAKIDNVSVEKLMETLSYPQVFKGLVLGDFYYDLASQQGTLTSTLNKAQLLENELTVLVKQLRGVDLTKERYNQTHFNAILNKNIIDIDFKAKSTKTLFAIPNGKINKLHNTINAEYQIDIENKDIGGKIKGDIRKPNVTLESSNYLKEKVVDVIKENISEETLQDLGLDKIDPDAIKNLLGDLFK